MEEDKSKARLLHLLKQMQSPSVQFPSFEQLQKKPVRYSLSDLERRRIFSAKGPFSRKWAVAASLLFIPLAGFVYYQTGRRASLPAAPELAGGVVIQISGKVLLTRAGLQEDLQAGSVLRVKDRLETRSGARVDLLLKGGIALRLQENSLFKMASAGNLQQVNVEAELDRGSLFAQVSKLQPGDNFAIRTPTAIAGVRGTSFRVLADDQGSKIELLEGKLAVVSQSQEKILNAGQIFLANRGNIAISPLGPERTEMLAIQQQLYKLSEENDAGVIASAAEVQTASSEEELIRIYGRNPDIIVLTDGRQLRGVVASQHGNKVIIQTPSGTYVVERSDLEEIRFIQ